MALDFPDNAFPVPSQYAHDYARRVESGFGRMRNRRVVIAGLVRNAIDVLPATIERIEQLGKHFADYWVVVGENDSDDGTTEMLQTWAESNCRVVLLSETLGDAVNEKTRCPQRGDRMARYRNQYLHLIAERFADLDSVIVVDMDLPGGWSEAGVANTFGWDDWDFVGSNGVVVQRNRWRLNRQFQYDTWAFRRQGSFDQMNNELVNLYSWRRGEPLEEVYSCFGGLGVYRMPAILSAEYAGGDCEHIALHRDMRTAGYSQTFMNPSQLVLYGRLPKRLDRYVRALNTAVYACTGIRAPA